MSITQMTRRRENRPTGEPVTFAAVRAMRPRQWLKNGLVAAAPFTSGLLLAPDVLRATLAAFLSFALVSSSVYLANDARDVEEDARHPTKCHRPIACGALPVPAAWVLCVVLCAAGLWLGFVTDPHLGLTLVVYVGLQAAYTWGLKRQAVVDLSIVASGFLLRAIAGGVAADIDLSPWFLLVASFGSLFMVAGKRYSELHQLGGDGATRSSLQRYSDSYLRFVWSLAAGVTVISYSLWALEQVQTFGNDWALVSIAPFVLALLRYAADIDRGMASAPEDIALRDRVLQALGVAWVLLVGLTVFTR
jgi:decaprenyl-phosphate phosphoribosyltransferase